MSVRTLIFDNGYITAFNNETYIISISNIHNNITVWQDYLDDLNDPLETISDTLHNLQYVTK